MVENSRLYGMSISFSIIHNSTNIYFYFFQPKTNSFSKKISHGELIWSQLTFRLPSHVGSHDLFHRAFHLCCDWADAGTFHFQYKICNWRKCRPMLCFATARSNYNDRPWGLVIIVLLLIIKCKNIQMLWHKKDLITLLLPHIGPLHVLWQVSFC